MNKIFCNILSALIFSKEKRHNFRQKHILNKSFFFDELYKKIEFLEQQNSNILLDIKKTQKFLSYHNIEKILSLKDKYKDQKCFIIGGSPSLKQLDLSKLNNSEYKVFTVGRGYKLKDSGLLHSNFHIISDIAGYSEIIDELDENYADIFFTYAGIEFANNVKDLIYFDYFENPINMDKHYQDDLTKKLFHCETVIDYALQIATYMGFKDIYFIGVDLDFNKNVGHIYKSTKGEKERQKSHSQNKNLFMLSSFVFATQYLKAKNINLYNASPSGILDCMSRVKYDELFNK